jgi:hypothetical protein
MTWLRMTMGATRLCNLARLNIHSDILDSISNEKLLKRFVEKSPRILDFGGSIFKAFHYLFLKSFCENLFFISSKFTN